ncbi:MAG TPA: ParB/RepB/Spo0J family partition protein [Patescibacteria group bacterium]|nr:ParB/RepB/Spo0J family partition protein [Patescibacteria group bacterium]
MEFPFLLTGKTIKISGSDENAPLYLPLESVFTQKNQVSESMLPSAVTPEPITSEVGKVSYGDASILEIDLAQIIANPYQPRKIFDQVALEELAESIKLHGVIQPLVVTQVPGGYELVVGERRFRASQIAGMKKVPAIIKQKMEDQTKLEVALIENIQRQELNPIEEAQAYQQLISKFSLSQAEVARKVGKSRPAVTNTLRLLNLPKEVQQAIVDGRISEGHARSLLPLQDPERILKMFKMAVEQNLNVRQIEHRVKEYTTRKRVDGLSTPDPSMQVLETTLRGKLGAPVKIQRVGRGGKITIEFFSDEELQTIVEYMQDRKQRSEQQPSPQEVYSEGVDTEGYLTV